ncbi:DUF6074 family protein [Rhizobium leguminosarum]|uniref:DUF6074 family protein n=1 Tax=Rhizobium leguminosarum TaxID=384 RepID=UPI00103E11C7|nr:DUF6074 family protein [Rhizobium leguminosarum]TBZ00227.1 hypothetical protein E0H49_15855 [Rhizobium leguminosarum bv. viciae]
MSNGERTDLPLISWQSPECRIIPFPMVKRVRKIRETAMKWLEKPTERSADHYERQVTEAMETGLKKLGLPDSEVDEQIAAFWSAVDREARRIVDAQQWQG